jgi:hypothetical protein
MARKKKINENILEFDEMLESEIESIENNIVTNYENRGLVKREDEITEVSDKNNKLIRLGDEVMWSGVIYVDSYGSSKTKDAFKPKLGVVDLINTNEVPVHIKGVGWVKIDQIKKV